VKPTIATNRANRWIERVRLNRYMHTSGQTTTARAVPRLQICDAWFLSTYRNPSRPSHTYVHAFSARYSFSSTRGLIVGTFVSAGEVVPPAGGSGTLSDFKSGTPMVEFLRS
jgi:hypothetical protein